ncbi:MAG: VCBS repeat-containing protein [Myxococcota bacterium]|nr:VCBS repeat-containing protein [Myxococcota bacterium]
MSAGKNIALGLRSVGILLGVWGVLGLVAWIADVLPARGESTSSAGAIAADDSSDAGVAADGTERDAGAAPDDAAAAVATVLDAGVDSGPPPTRGERELWATCLSLRQPLVGEMAALGVGSIVGDERPELLAALGSEVHVIGLHEGRPMRVATLGMPGTASPARPTVADVTGDGRTDLIVGYARLGDDGGPVGGTLQLVPGHPLGGLEEPRLLAPIAVTGIATVPAERGAWVAAANWTDGFGRRASELWTFAGGASPVRRGRARLGNDVTDVVAADVDGAGEVELVALDAIGLTRISPDGGRESALDLARATHALAQDLDGDSKTDVVIVAEGLHVVRGGVEPIEAHPIDAPAGLRRLVAADVDADGRVDLIAASREGIVVLMQRDAFVFAEERPIELPAAFRPHDLAVVRMDDLLRLVVVGAGSRGFELVAVPLGGRVDVAVGETPLIADAPLHLALPLR